MGPGGSIGDKFMQPAGPFRIGNLWRTGGLAIDSHWILELRCRPSSDDPPPLGHNTLKCFNREISSQCDYCLNERYVSNRHNGMRTGCPTRLQNDGCSMIPPESSMSNRHCANPEEIGRAHV